MATDMELLEAWRGGDKQAGAALFERYYPSVVRFFRNKVSEQVRDLVQQTFTACLEGRDRIRDTGNFRAYLFATARNVLALHLRGKYRSGEAIDLDKVSIRDLSPGPSSMVARRREHRLLLESLRSIPIDAQVLLELRYWEQLKTVEIGEILAIPHPTVRSRLHRAQQKLKAAMEKLAQSPEELHSTLANLDDWARDCREQVT